MVKVSILVATRNYAAYIEECLDSIYLQSYTDYEVIVYDDASTDETKELIARYPVKYLRGEKQAGQSKAKNKALEASSGEYVFFLDADNRFTYSTSLSAFVEKMESDKKIGFVYSDRKFFGTRNEYYRTGDINPMIWNMNFVDGNMLSRRKAFGEYDEKLVKLTDWDRILHMLKEKWLPGYVPSPLIMYRFHDDNTGTFYKSRTEEMANYIREKYRGVKR